MSVLRVNTIRNRTNDGGPVLSGLSTVSGNLEVTGDSTVTGLVTATGGFNIGIQSGGVSIASSISNLNFVGTGNTFLYNTSTNTVDISIAGGGGGGVGTAINYGDNTTSPFSYIDASVTATQSMVLDAQNAGTSDSYIVVQEPTLIVASGVGITVGAGKTLVQDLYRLGGL